MTTISVRELRNEVSDVVRRAEAGEELTVTVRGRPAARIGPLERRPRSMPTTALITALERVGADEGLLDDLAEVLVDTTDDV